jgi:hypothetical protein
MPDSYVASIFKMLTYSLVCCAFSSACALPSDLIRGFEKASCEKLTVNRRIRGFKDSRGQASNKQKTKRQRHIAKRDKKAEG